MNAIDTPSIQLFENYFAPDLLKYNDPDMTTNSCESINSGLNKNCHTIRSKNALFNKIYEHKDRHMERYTHVVKLDHLSVVKRRKFVT